MKSSSSSSESFDYAAAYHEAYFVCTGGPLQPRIEIPRWNTNAIREHKANCEKCSQLEKQRAEEQRLKNEGPLRIQYCLRMIEKANDDIDYYERLKSEVNEKKERGEEVDGLELERLRLAEYDSGVAKSKIESETAELHRLLNDEENETVREGAKTEYKKYEKYLNRITNKNNKKKEKEG